MTHTTLTSLFDDIADAIREKTGSTDEIVADDFPDAISDIPTGGGATGNATVGDVLSGKTFSNSTSSGLTGTMANNGPTGATLTTQGSSYTVPAGYTSGGTVIANLSSGSATTPETTITAQPTITASNGNITASYSGSQDITPTITPGYITQTQATAGTVSTSGTQTVAATTLDSNLLAQNIAKDVTIFGVTGTHSGGITPTGTITLTAANKDLDRNVYSYETARVQAGSVNTPDTTKQQSKPTFSQNGNIITADVAQTSVEVTPNVSLAGWVSSGTKGVITMSANSDTYTIPSGSATTPETTITTNPTITASGGNIVSTYSGEEDITPTISAGYISSGTSGKVSTTGTTTVAATTLDSNLVAQNIAEGVTIFGVEGTHSGGIIPTGTEEITADTSDKTVNVYSKQYALVHPTPSEEKAATGSGDVTPSSGKLLNKVTIASGSATTPATTITSNPTITSSNGNITATHSGSETVTPTISAGWVSAGTSGTIETTGTATVTATSLEPNLLEGNIVDGVTIFGVEGTYSGIIPIGNKELEQQTGTDVTSYATASVKSGSITAGSGSASLSGSNVTLSDTNNGISVTATGSGSVTSSEGWVNSGSTSSSEATETKYISSVTVPKTKTLSVATEAGDTLETSIGLSVTNNTNRFTYVTNGASATTLVSNSGGAFVDNTNTSYLSVSDKNDPSTRQMIINAGEWVTQTITPSSSIQGPYYGETYVAASTASSDYVTGTLAISSMDYTATFSNLTGDSILFSIYFASDASSISTINFAQDLIPLVEGSYNVVKHTTNGSTGAVPHSLITATVTKSGNYYTVTVTNPLGELGRSVSSDAFARAVVFRS